jgi:predicted DNA binding CopG/RHH family protein
LKVNKKSTEYRPFNLQLPPEMYEAARAKAAEQGISMQRFIRMGVSGLTGVPDPTSPYRRHPKTV